MTKLTIIIDDTKWPKLRATFIREKENGSVDTSTDERLYDTAYTVFENAAHNHLRPAVGEIIDRRMKKATQPQGS